VEADEDAARNINMMQDKDTTMNPKYIITIVLLLMCSGTASAWLSGWDHRVEIPVNNTGDVLTYHQYNFTMDTATEIAAGNMSYADGRDCRMTDVSDNLLPIWNETSFNESDTKIWVNGPSLDNVTNTTHYLYYGKSGASSVADINAMGCFGDSFEGSSLDVASSDSFSIEFTKAIGNYSCHGIPSISNQSGTFYTGWHYSYESDVAGNSPENITKVLLYPNNNTNSGIGWITEYDGYDHETVSQIEKLGNTYYAFFINATGGTNTQPWVINYRNSSDGNTWNGPYALSVSSTGREASPRLMQINDTVWWLVYPYGNDIRYTPFNVTTKAFGTEGTIVATGATAYMPHALYVSGSDQYFIYYWQAGSPNSVKVVNRTGYGAWSSPTTVVADTGGVYTQGWTIYWNSKYYMFYHDSGYDLKVMDSTDGISFSAMQTLHSHASNYYWYPAVVPINDTHLAMVYGWHIPTNVKSIMYWDILKFTEGGSSGKWEEKNSPTVSVANGICSVYYAGTTDWAGIIGNQSFGAYNYAYRQRVKYDSKTGVFAGACDAWSDAGTYNDGMFFLEYTDGLYIRTRNEGVQQQTVDTSERTKYHTDEFRWKSGEVKIYRDGSLNATHTTQVPDSALYPFFASLKGSDSSGYAYIDWCFVRKYASPEPIASVGAVEDAPAGNNAYIPPTPTTLANTTGNFWVHHTWAAGSGNVTDSYNVSQNGTWTNTSANIYFNATDVGAHGYSDVTVWAWNSSGSGTLSAGSITQNTTVPNNAITITNTSDWSGNAGDNVYVDYDATDADSDTPTFSCNRTDLFTDFSTSTGKGNWTSTAGTYYVDFGVSDGYSSTSNYTMTIFASMTVTLLSQTPSTIYQNTTGNLNISYGISHDSSGLNNTSVSFIFRNYDHT
jgi:hypothetical protein